MEPSYEVDITLHDGTIVDGKVMYVIVWAGKAISGGEELVRGDDIASMTVTPVED